MRPLNLITLFTTILLLSIGAGPCKADITPIDYSPPPAGGSVTPVDPHDRIRLESQDVLIRLGSYGYTVDAVFHLNNTGVGTHEWVGFPKQTHGRGPGPRGKISNFLSFKVLVNGRIVPFRESHHGVTKNLQTIVNRGNIRTGSWKWMLGKAFFPANSVTKIRVTYESSYQSCGWECEQADYVYGTGRFWKGKIGKAVFIIDSIEQGGANRTSPRFAGLGDRSGPILKRVISPNLMRCEIRDFEPDANGGLTIMLTSLTRINPANKEESLQRLMWTGARNGRLEMVKQAVEKGADVNEVDFSSETPLMNAAKSGSLEVVKYLVENGADINANIKGKTPLTSALGEAWLIRGHLEVAEYLHKKGAKPTNLATACFVGDLDAVKEFIKQGAKINPQTGKKKSVNNPSPIVAAAMGSNTEVLKLLLGKGLDVESKNGHGETLLAIAAEAGHADMIKLLLDKGANVEAKTWIHNKSALIEAADRGHYEAVKALLKGGANTSVKDRHGHTALSRVKGKKEREDIAKLLVQYGAK